jgi:hypothetical protein
MENEIKTKGSEKGYRVFAFEIVVVLATILITLGVALPAYNRSKDKAKEAEVKNNLHTIQLALERFCIDMDGNYPQYLIGGEMPGVPDPLQNVSRKALYSDPNVNKRLMQSDPLIRRGYMGCYPKNPFVNSKSVASIENLQIEVRDPLRVGAEGDKQDYRFGKDCNVMGNVSCDYRYPDYVDVTTGEGPKTVKSYADFDGYPFFDVWHGNRPSLYLPGEFFYKSNGEIVAADPSAIDTLKPVKPFVTEMYILGGYGSIRTKGKDVFGPEPEIIAYVYPDRKQDDLNYEASFGCIAALRKIMIPSWTRWLIKKDDEGCFPGSPYSVSTIIGFHQLSPGNPNGIPDGIVCVLTSEDK